MSDPNHQQRFERALNSNDPTSGLTQLAKDLKKEGVSQLRLFKLYQRFQIQTDGNHPGYDAIPDTMDLIAGGPWAKGGDLFDTPLTDNDMKIR